MEKLEQIILNLGFESVSEFAKIRLVAFLKKNTQSIYLFTPQIVFFKEQIFLLEQNQISVEDFLTGISIDFVDFLRQELLFFCQENIQLCKFQIQIFKKKYFLESYTELSQNYHQITQVADNEKDSDEIVWENLIHLKQELSEILTEILLWNQEQK